MTPISTLVPSTDSPTRPADSPEGGAVAPTPALAAAERSGRRPAARAAQAQRAFPRAERPGTVPAPEHHHLPGWVRRDYARYRPVLADLLGLLQGDERAQLRKRVEEVTAAISSGKFSMAWQYPEVIEEGRRAYERQRDLIAETQRQLRAVEGARRKAADRLREAGESLTPDAVARLQRALRAAGDAAAIAEVQDEAERALAQGRSSRTRRRDREIDKTRARLLRTLPAAAAAADDGAGETWQDVLRRFAEDQSTTANGDAG